MSTENIKVIVRCRPLNKREISFNAQNIIVVNSNVAQVIVNSPDKSQTANEEHIQQIFTFDKVFGTQSMNIDLFNQSFKPVVQAVTQGYNACIFTYGQTGCGKTFTMSGEQSDEGCISNSFDCIFDYISTIPNSVKIVLKASYIEIHNEKIKDLVTNLNDLPVNESKELGIYVGNLSEHLCCTKTDLQKVREDGYKNRNLQWWALEMLF
ncbi:Kinesin-like_protein [Hexamita inflata]|uniref:Kinesin-like protein n=1 Tax=Hexamita inflata TaxID=28002 RepID=A0AA86QYX9_9EUKA|nr:Kinesin-like protein [Hexamita inflata]